jgi:hypothetical protein
LAPNNRHTNHRCQTGDNLRGHKTIKAENTPKTRCFAAFVPHFSPILKAQGIQGFFRELRRDPKMEAAGEVKK